MEKEWINVAAYVQVPDELDLFDLDDEIQVVHEDLDRVMGFS